MTDLLRNCRGVEGQQASGGPRRMRERSKCGRGAFVVMPRDIREE